MSEEASVNHVWGRGGWGGEQSKVNEGYRPLTSLRVEDVI